jgi:hypothetical protein
MSNYLRNRPFMVISYTYVLAGGQDSRAKNFGENAEWEPIENMVIVDRVSTKQMASAEMVIDLFENKVLKARGIDVAAEQEKLLNMFVSRYFDDVKAALTTWIQKDPMNLKKVQEFIDRFSAKTEEVVDATEETTDAE